MGKKSQRRAIKSPPARKSISTRRNDQAASLFPWLLLAVIITAVCFFPVLKNGFTNWDDNFYVVNNPMLPGPDWKAIFTQPVAANYHPLTMISLAINYQLSGLDPFSYSLFNLLFHLINTGLVFYFIYLVSGKKLFVAFLTAVIFGIHPMHVESVAWISERKDVLYTLFFLLALIQYWKYLQQGKKLSYWLCFLFFLLSLLSKPAAIVFPLVLFLLDYWKGAAVNRKLFVEKLPFFLFAILFAVMTLRIQSSTAMADLHVFPLWTRLFFACYGVMIYLVRFLIPYPLSSFHPFPPAANLGWPVLGSPIFIIALALFLWFMRKKKIFVFGTFFYIFNLLLVLQIISVGLTITSERYTYIPYIGLAFIGSSLLEKFSNGLGKYSSWSIASIIILAFGFISFQHIGVWKNSATLWTNVIEHYPNSSYARTNRANFTIGLAQSPSNKSKADSLLQQALEDCNIAVQQDPIHIPGYQNRINVFLIFNRNQEALADAESLTRLDPANPAGYLTKGIVYSKIKEPDKALINLNKTLELNPSSITALNLRGTLLVNNYQRFSDALPDFNKAISLNPSADLYLSRSICYYRLGDIEHAKTDAQIALQKGITIDDNYRRLLKL
jgi:tetratricopeptide (TPR) repeat protein